MKKIARGAKQGRVRRQTMATESHKLDQGLFNHPAYIIGIIKCKFYMYASILGLTYVSVTVSKSTQSTTMTKETGIEPIPTSAGYYPNLNKKTEKEILKANFLSTMNYTHS